MRHWPSGNDLRRIPTKTLEALLGCGCGAYEGDIDIDATTHCSGVACAVCRLSSQCLDRDAFIDDVLCNRAKKKMKTEKTVATATKSDETEITITVKLPEGYNATGEFRVPKPGDYYQNIFTGSAYHCDTGEETGGEQRIILKKIEPLVESFTGKTISGHHRIIFDGNTQKAIEIFCLDNPNKKFKVTLEEIF